MHQRHDVSVGALLLVRLRLAFAPDGGELGDVGNAEADAHCLGVLDVITVVVVGFDAGVGVLFVQVEAAAYVA